MGVGEGLGSLHKLLKKKHNSQFI